MIAWRFRSSTGMCGKVWLERVCGTVEICMKPCTVIPMDKRIEWKGGEQGSQWEYMAGKVSESTVCMKKEVTVGAECRSEWGRKSQ